MKNSFRLNLSHRSGFTLVELLVSVAVISLIMVVLVGMTNQISQTWRSTTGKIEQFQQARDGFETMTRKLSQATLNTFWDLYYVNVAGRQAPRDFVRQSQLRFLSGPMSKLAPDSTRPTHGVFFQAPLGFVDDNETLGGMNNLLNTWGYFLEVSDDSDTRPTFLQSVVPSRTRSRLMELMQPTELMSVYDLDPKGAPTPVPGDQLNWFKPAITQSNRPVRAVADNVIALIIWPRLSKQEEDIRRKAGKSVLSPNYIYDSNLDPFKSSRYGTTQNPVWLNQGAKLVSASDLQEAAEINPKNQLPPVVQVTMVALDEASASRLIDRKGKEGSVTLVNGLFNEACPAGTRDTEETTYEKDLKTLEGRMVEANLTYRIFSTSVIIRGAKWSTSQSK